MTSTCIPIRMAGLTQAAWFMARWDPRWLSNELSVCQQCHHPFAATTTKQTTASETCARDKGPPLPRTSTPREAQSTKDRHPKRKKQHKGRRKLAKEWETKCEEESAAHGRKNKVEKTAVRIDGTILGADDTELTSEGADFVRLREEDARTFEGVPVRTAHPKGEANDDPNMRASILHFGPNLSLTLDDLESSVEFESSTMLANISSSEMSLCHRCCYTVRQQTSEPGSPIRSGQHSWDSGFDSTLTLYEDLKRLGNDEDFPSLWGPHTGKQRKASEASSLKDSAFHSDDKESLSGDDGSDDDDDTTTLSVSSNDNHHENTDISGYHTVLSGESKTSAVESDDSPTFLPCKRHPNRVMILYCVTCEVPICCVCRARKHAGHATCSLLALSTGFEHPRDLEGHLERIQSNLAGYDTYLARHQEAIQKHLLARKEYYTEAIEKWYWQSMSAVESEYKREVSRIEEMSKRLQRTQEDVRAMEDYTKSVTRSAAHSKSSLPHTESNLMNKVCHLKRDVQNLSNTEKSWGLKSFLIGRCQDMNQQTLGTIICQDKHNSLSDLCDAGSATRTSDDASEKTVSADHNDNQTDNKDSVKNCKLVVPRSILPSRCLYQFDTRHGLESSYMATGLSLTDKGDLLVTDNGMNTVQLFTASGTWRKELFLSPGAEPSKAVQFTEDVAAVACVNGVRLYDLTTGLYSDQQLRSSLQRPQGITLDSNGNLVVSGCHANLPALATYDRTSYEWKSVMLGDTFCMVAEEDEIGTFTEYTDSLMKQTLFSLPWYITADPSNNVLISDRDTHSVRTVSQSRRLLNEQGQLGAGVGDLFNPAGLCVDPAGNTIIADSQNNKIKLLLADTDGQALVLLDQESDNIECPMDVALDTQGRLFVLQGDGVVKVFQYS